MERVEEERRLNTPTSVADIPHFPFATFAGFVEAHGDGDALVWVRYDFHSLWTLLEGRDRLWHLALLGNGGFGALLFGLWVSAGHDHRLLLAAPVLLLGFVFATPSPGLLNGCAPFALTFGGLLWGVVSGHPALAVLGVSFGMSWFVSCAALGIADAAVRTAMVQSEETFLWLHARGVITDVKKRVPPEADPAVWPPPPQTR